jgi:hypothetical protein
MKIQFYYRFDHTFRSLWTITLVILAALLIAPSALADRCLDKYGNLKPHAPPGCAPAEQLPADQIIDTGAFLFDNHGHEAGGEDHGHFVEDGARDFIQNGLSFESGDFVAGDLSQGILVNTSELSCSTKGHPRELCRLLEDDIMLYAEAYSYGWVDDCRDGDCAIEIRFTIGGPGSISGTDILEFSDGKSNQIDIVMHSVIMDSTDPNPFMVARDIPISRTVAEFKKTGTSRTLVKCEFMASGWGGPWFHSVPQ